MPMSATAIDPIAMVEGVAPLVRAHPNAAERDHQLPAPLAHGLIDAGLFRLLASRTLSGHEVDPATFYRAVEALVRGDASAAVA